MSFSRRDAFFVIFSLFLVLSSVDSIRALMRFALDVDNTPASQIILVPFISATLFYLDRKKFFQSVRYSALAGTLVVVLGAALLIVGRVWGTHLMEGDRLAVMTASIVLMWIGGFLFFYGFAAFKVALFPLLFLVFCIPIPSLLLDRTIDFLRRGSTDTAFVLLKLSGTPIYRQGFIFTLPDLVIEVAPECSGIRSGISLLILSLLAGHLFFRSLWRWGVLIIATIPVLIFKNALRIGVLSYLAVHVDKRILASRLHQEGGIPFFALGLLMIYPIFMTLMKSEGKLKTAASSITREAGL